MHHTFEREDTTSQAAKTGDNWKDRVMTVAGDDVTIMMIGVTGMRTADMTVEDHHTDETLGGTVPGEENNLM